MRLARDLLRAALSIALVWWIVASATFALMKAIPGGPLSQERNPPTEVRAAIEKLYHLNDPLWMQYRDYIVEAAAFRFGISFDNRRPVGQIIAERLPRSAALGAFALAIAVAAAFILGTAAALGRGGPPDRALSIVSALGVSVPSFILGSVLLYWFSLRLGVFGTGWGGIGQAILPAIALAALPTAYLARLVRTGLAEVMRAEFMLAARARGLSNFKTALVHGLPHALGPVLAYLGPQAAGIMTGSFVVEQIFNIPGLGILYVKSIGNRDYPLIMGVTLVYTVLLVAFNLLADLAARLIDPRLAAK